VTDTAHVASALEKAEPAFENFLKISYAPLIPAKVSAISPSLFFHKLKSFTRSYSSFNFFALSLARIPSAVYLSLSAYYKASLHLSK